MIDTFNLYIYFKDGSIEYNNISRVAVKRFIEFWRENEGFYGYDLDDSKLDRDSQGFA